MKEEIPTLFAEQLSVETLRPFAIVLSPVLLSIASILHKSVTLMKGMIKQSHCPVKVFYSLLYLQSANNDFFYFIKSHSCLFVVRCNVMEWP